MQAVANDFDSTPGSWADEMIDHRKLLKDCIRGMVWESDVPALLGLR